MISATVWTNPVTFFFILLCVGTFSFHCVHRYTASLVAQTVKRLPPTRETRVRSLGREVPLEKEMATHSSTLAWKIPWGCKESEMTERLHFTDSNNKTTISWIKILNYQEKYIYICVLFIPKAFSKIML